MKNPIPLIAVVDDDKGVRSALVRLLRSSGLDAKSYASGQVFIAALPLDRPACAILDLHMSGMNGFEVQKRLAKDWPAVPVIVITGNHSPETLDKVMRHPPAAYLHKPVDSQLLLDAINTALQADSPGSSQKTASSFTN